jgi:hypothetical protein
VVVLGEAGTTGRTRIGHQDYRQRLVLTFTVMVGAKAYEICSNGHPGGARIRGAVNGSLCAAQVERSVGKNPHPGRSTRLDALVLSRAAGTLHSLMKFNCA